MSKRQKEGERWRGKLSEREKEGERKTDRGHCNDRERKVEY